MLFLYSIALSLAFILMLPLFVLRRAKYAAGFSQRLGNYPRFDHDGRPVIWIHCVSVGETNAARPLVNALKQRFPLHRLIVSTTTKTGQELATKIFAEKAEAVFYFPFDWKFSVKRALERYKPAAVLLMETEIWPRFISEAKLSGAKVAIVNGRLSNRSTGRYSLARRFIGSVLDDVDLALMQGGNDAERIIGLGCKRSLVTGNLKFDLDLENDDDAITEELDSRFGFTSSGRPLIVAASTHDPEERFVLDAFCSTAAGSQTIKPRLLIAPRHPERFDQVAKTVREFSNGPACEFPGFKTARRSDGISPDHADSDIIILDSIGELRAVYPLAEIVFVGGSIIPHGGQSILEPAAAGKAIITGHHTHNFEDAVHAFLDSGAIIQLPDKAGEQIVDELFISFVDLLENDDERRSLGLNAAAVMNANRGATRRTIDALIEILK